MRGGRMRKVVNIGLPELNDDELAEIGELAQKTVMDNLLAGFRRSDLIDIDVIARVIHDGTLHLELEVYVEVPVFVDVDVEGLVEGAMERAYAEVEELLRRKAREGGRKQERGAYGSNKGEL